MEKKRQLLDEYRFPGFRSRSDVHGVFGDPKVRVIRLERTQKKRSVDFVGNYTEAITTRRLGGYGIYHVGMHAYTWKWKSGGYYARHKQWIEIPNSIEYPLDLVKATSDGFSKSPLVIC